MLRSSLKTAIRRVSRNKIVKRRLPASFGSAMLYASPDSALSYFNRTLKSDLFKAVDQYVRANDHVWDIGSNVGLFTFAAAHRVGPGGGVLAVEADAFLVSLLRRTARRNNYPTQILTAAVCDEIGIARLNIAQNGRSSNFLSSLLGAPTAGGIRYSEDVITITLDWLLQHRPAPNFIKIDIEGAELLALRGAKNLLSSARPILLMELAGTHQSECMSILKSAGYTLTGWGETQEERYCNFLAIPSEQAKDVPA